MSSSFHISEPALNSNVAAVRGPLGAATALLAVIKADSYGHSATVTAPMFARAGVPWLGVTDAREGARVRAALHTAGFPQHQPRILIMTAPPGDPASASHDAALAHRHRLTPLVFTPAQLTPLAPGTAIHLEIDTGMCRQGVQPGAALEAFLRALAQRPDVTLEAVCTHLASADRIDARQTLAQFSRFEQAVAAVYAACRHPTLLHIGNTSTFDNGSPAAAPMIARFETLGHSHSAQPMLRAGLALYGISLPLDPDTPMIARIRSSLTPILTWSTTITSIAEVPAGAHIGYSATFTAPHPMRLALLPVGYADGLRRALSSSNQRRVPLTRPQPGGWVVLHGERAPIVGRISMNLTTIDVTHIPAAQPGSPVTLLGPGITAEDHARLARCLPYEILCGLKPDGSSKL